MAALITSRSAVLSAEECAAIRDLLIDAVTAAVAEGVELGPAHLSALRAIREAAQGVGSVAVAIGCDSLRSDATDEEAGEDWIWIAEAAEIAGVSPQALTRACRENRIRHRSIGGRWMTTRAAAMQHRRRHP